MSSCFIADDGHVKIVWLHVVAFSEHDILYFCDNVHLLKYYPVKSPQNCFKVGLSPSKNICVICFIVNPLRTMKNAFYVILKALLVLKVFKFLSWVFGHAGKTTWLERYG